VVWVVNGRWQTVKMDSVAPAISGLPADIMQSRKKVFEFAFICALGSVDCFAHHAVQAIQLIAGEFNEVAFHGAGSPFMMLGETTTIAPAAPHSNLIAAGQVRS